MINPLFNSSLSANHDKVEGLSAKTEMYLPSHFIYLVFLSIVLFYLSILFFYLSIYLVILSIYLVILSINLVILSINLVILSIYLFSIFYLSNPLSIYLSMYLPATLFHKFIILLFFDKHFSSISRR